MGIMRFAATRNRRTHSHYLLSPQRLSRVSIRFCGHRIASREELGLPKKIDELARRPNGLILISGPTGAGKTTTLNYLVNSSTRSGVARLSRSKTPLNSFTKTSAPSLCNRKC